MISFTDEFRVLLLYDKMNTRPWSKRPALRDEKEEGGRLARRRQTRPFTQPSEDVRDEARWLDETDRRDAAANAEGKVISVQESSRGREPRRYAKVTSFFTLLKETVQINHLDKRTSRAIYQHITGA